MNLDDHTQKIKQSMQESAEAYFSVATLEDLFVLIRLTVEFHDYLHNGIPRLRHVLFKDASTKAGCEPTKAEVGNKELEYSIESIFSGIDSFCNVVHAYKALICMRGSELKLKTVSRQLLNDQFVALFQEFTKEIEFSRKCRLLLDLFKLQIIFAGLFYGDADNLMVDSPTA